MKSLKSFLGRTALPEYGIGQGCFPMIHVGYYGYVAYVHFSG